MYAYIQGKLIETSLLHAIVDVNGIGYKIGIPVSLLGKLPRAGTTVLFYTSWIVREESQTLYGFLEKRERDLFELLLTLSGVGPKTALSLIGHLSPADLERAVQTNASETLVKVPGIGKKTADRILLDLKDKFPAFSKGKEVYSPFSPNVRDAITALVNLGYPQKTAESAVVKVLKNVSEETDLSTLILLALKSK